MSILLRERVLDPRQYWKSWQVQESIDEIVHVLFESPYRLRVTFPAVSDPERVSDAIGMCFEAVFDESERILDVEEDWDMLAHPPSDDNDPRLQVVTTLAILDSLLQPYSVFGA